MADQKKNDVAAALAALAGGAVPSEGETPSGGIPSESTVFSPAKATPAAPQATQPSQSVETPATPVAPRLVRQASPRLANPGQANPSQANPSQASPRQAIPRQATPPMPPTSMPKMPPIPSAVPPPAKIRAASPDGASPPRARPAMPERRPSIAPPTPVFEVPDTLPELIDDDEETIADAPDASAFARRVIVQKPAHAPVYANLFFRRTIIPIMLTCGVMLPAIGVWSIMDANAPLARAGNAFDISLIVVGAVLFLLGVLNALQIKHVLDSAAKANPH